MTKSTLESLVGEVLAYIDTDGEEEILFTTVSGRRIKFCHYQDCCETVRIQDTLGNWHDLIGKVIIEAGEEIDHPPVRDYESATLTTLIFRVDDATVISKWIGESNGYYSENVDIFEITK